jgi:dUTP pyrophosphatase
VPNFNFNSAGEFLRVIGENKGLHEWVSEQFEPTDLEIRYKRTMANAVPPYYATPGSVGFDLSTAEEVIIQPRSITRITTGLVIATPPGHYMRITGRSSTPMKHEVMVIEGVIDQDYCGDDDVLALQVWNFTDTPSRVPLQARIAQGIFIPVATGRFVETNKMGESRGGFGSTG